MRKMLVKFEQGYPQQGPPNAGGVG